jgi:hypothetical protein
MACGTTGGGRKADGLPEDDRLRAALTGEFHGYWTGAASGTALRSKEGGLLEIPIVLDADLESAMHWDMDATDFGELLLEKAGHYNSSVWFVATEIEVQGSRIYITKFEESYEDTLCLELVEVDADGVMRFQAHSFLADPGQGEREACLDGRLQYDALLLLRPGPGNSPEFVESGSIHRFGAEPEEEGEQEDSSEEQSDEL